MNYTNFAMIRPDFQYDDTIVNSVRETD